jgi:hypothetical protein
MKTSNIYNILLFTAMLLTKMVTTVFADEEIQANTSSMASVDEILKDHPSIEMRHYTWFHNIRSVGDINGRLILHSDLFGRQYPKASAVFLLPADNYTRWAASLQIYQSLGYDYHKETSLNNGVWKCCGLQTFTDYNGNFVFPSMPKGSYYIYAVVKIISGETQPMEQIENGWDAKGHAQKTLIPDIIYTKKAYHDERFAFFHEYTFDSDEKTWDIGDLSNSIYIIDGKEKS